MTEISFAENYSSEKYLSFPFYMSGIPVSCARWGITLKAAGSMRFRWNETNSLRDKTLSEIALGFGGKKIVSVQLDHTKIVYEADFSADTFEKIGDGIVTANSNLMPVVTVADCMPLFLYDYSTGRFGVVHSGWKGTGIIANAVDLLVQRGSQRNNICVAIGPHIHDCCYVVNQERAEYFTKNFSQDCVVPIKDGEILCKGAASNWDSGAGQLFRLSLLKANLNVLEKSGIKMENVVVAKECTCCNEMFGSNRRETSIGKDFTVQAAFVAIQN